MEGLTIDTDSTRRVAEALAIGLLVGIERYKSRSESEKGSAGVRTFAAFGLLGGVCGLLAQPTFTLAAFAAIAALIIVGYYRESTHAVGLTTEISALLVFWLGVLVYTREALAISAAIVLTLLLASKDALHRFVKDSVTETELFDTLKYLAVVLVVFPLLPDRNLGPFGFFNPRNVWLLVILVSTIGYAGYLLVRWFGGRRGLILSAVAGGLVSTTATTVAIAARARQLPGASRFLGTTAVLANAVQFPRLLLLLWVVNRSFARTLSVPLLGMAAAGFVGALVLSRRERAAKDKPKVEMPLTNPFSLMASLKFGAFFAAVLLLVRAAEAWLGETGVFLASALGGGVSASAVALTAAGLVSKSTISAPAGAIALLLGISTNALVKWTIARTQGTGKLAFWVGGGLATMVATGFLLLALSTRTPLF
ncbi:MAG: MgtC/SapB family protein [Acidobacteriota bacterium]|nr:MgtC/SapB family protein [Acidobacteriota bacterium]